LAPQQKKRAILTTAVPQLEGQPAELYEARFYKLLGRCQSQPGKHKFRFNNPPYSLDASALDLDAPNGLEALLNKELASLLGFDRRLST